jgi:WD40 repeat protein
MNAEAWASKETEIALKTAIMPHTQNENEKFKDVTSVTWSPDGRFLATGCYDGMARIWDNQGNLVTSLKEHTGPVFSLKWNKSGAYILSGSYDRRAIVWNAETGQIVKIFLLHSGPVLDVDWRDSTSFATCSSDRYDFFAVAYCYFVVTLLLRSCCFAFLFLFSFLCPFLHILVLFYYSCVSLYCCCASFRWC